MLHKYKSLFTKKRPMIIAEIGNNHEGSFNTAIKLIDEASKCGVDAVKFQTFKTEAYVNDKEKLKIKRLKKFELSEKKFELLAKYSKKKKLIFISTPFDIKSAIFLNKIVDYFKISSGDNNFNQLIEKVLSYKKPTIISCGLINSSQIKKLLKVVKNTKFPLNKLFLLHCVSSYPVEDQEANLRSINYIRNKFKVNVGYSDHSLGIEASIIASAFGAKVIEKHFTLRKNFSNFRDHKISADPAEMLNLVRSVKRASEMVGDYSKKISINEQKNISSMRRSIYLKSDLKKGDKITFDNIKFVRPFKFLSTSEINKVLNKSVKKKINKNEPLSLKNIKN